MKPISNSTSRRKFIRTGTLTFIGAGLAPRLKADEPGKKLFSAMGIAAPLDKAGFFKAAGAEFLTESVGKFLIPDQAEADFEKNLAKLAASPLPILACNGFIRPADLHCVGPEANHELIFAWADTTFRRMKKAGGKFIVFGSGSARRIPDGWPRDQAKSQFVSLLKGLGPLAEAQGITVTVEQLRKEECNLINHIRDCAELIRAAGHPNVRVLADLYHMACMGDTPADLKSAMDVVAHVEIAEKETRSLPGVSGDDFRPYFRILRESNYAGAVNMEGKYTDDQVAPAFQEIARQASDV